MPQQDRYLVRRPLEDATRRLVRRLSRGRNVRAARIRDLFERCVAGLAGGGLRPLPGTFIDLHANDVDRCEPQFGQPPSRARGHARGVILQSVIHDDGADLPARDQTGALSMGRGERQRGRIRAAGTRHQHESLTIEVMAGLMA